MMVAAEALELGHLEGALQEDRVPIERLLSVRVTTSPRLNGRARRGLSPDLARAALGRPAGASVKSGAP